MEKTLDGTLDTFGSKLSQNGLSIGELHPSTNFSEGLFYTDGKKYKILVTSVWPLIQDHTLLKGHFINMETDVYEKQDSFVLSKEESKTWQLLQH